MLSRKLAPFHSSPVPRTPVELLQLSMVHLTATIWPLHVHCSYQWNCRTDRMQTLTRKQAAKLTTQAEFGCRLTRATSPQIECHTDIPKCEMSKFSPKTSLDRCQSTVDDFVSGCDRLQRMLLPSAEKRTSSHFGTLSRCDNISYASWRFGSMTVVVFFFFHFSASPCLQSDQALGDASDELRRMIVNGTREVIFCTAEWRAGWIVQGGVYKRQHKRKLIPW